MTEMNTALMELAQQLTADNLDEAMDGLAYEVAGTFLEELDEDNIRVRFRELMTNSILCKKVFHYPAKFLFLLQKWSSLFLQVLFVQSFFQRTLL